MNIENYEQLCETLYRKGFEEDLNEALKAKMEAGVPEFVLNKDILSKTEDGLSYRLHFRKDEETGKVYFNKFDLVLKPVDAPEVTREQTFLAKQMITAMEACRMLKYGELVAVYKSLFNKEGNQYNAWLTCNVNSPTDDQLNHYHENYYKKEAFVIKDELKKIQVPVKQLENPAFLEGIEQSLRKANLVQVTMMLDGVEQEGFLSVNAQRGKVQLLDAQFKLVEGQSQEQKHTVEDDLKKKSTNGEKVNWKEGQNRGLSR